MRRWGLNIEKKFHLLGSSLMKTSHAVFYLLGIFTRSFAEMVSSY